MAKESQMDARVHEMVRQAQHGASGENQASPLLWLSSMASAIYASVNVMWLLLLGMMVLDYVSGVLSASINGKLSADRMGKGVAKKLMVLLIVFGVQLLQKVSEVSNLVHLPIQLSSIACAFFVVTEMTSLVENAYESGIQIPEILVKVLIKARQPQATREEIQQMRDESVVKLDEVASVGVAKLGRTLDRGIEKIERTRAKGVAQLDASAEEANDARR